MLCVNPIKVPRKLSSNAADIKWQEVPCGQCIACRVNRKRDWAIRMSHEAQYHPTVSFITLTYDGCKRDPVLSKQDLQNFLKRLRYYYPYKFRFFACGEYGSQTARPHYHAILFGFDPTHISYLYKAWQFGFVTCMPVKKGAFEYVAKYCVKTDDRQYPDGWQLPFCSMSKGLGKRWIDDNRAAVSGKNNVAYTGKVFYKHIQVTAPRYYRNRVLTVTDKFLYNSFLNKDTYYKFIYRRRNCIDNSDYIVYNNLVESHDNVLLNSQSRIDSYVRKQRMYAAKL